MAKQTFTSGQVLTAAQVNALQANDYNQTVSTKTASYTLVAADAGTKIVMNAGATNTTITVNTSLFAAGDTLQILNISTSGVCTVTAGTATIASAGNLALGLNQGGTLYFTSAGVSVFQATSILKDARTAYTPALTNVTIGNGALDGHYYRIGKYVGGGIYLGFGSTTSVSGIIGIGLPFTVASSINNRSAANLAYGDTGVTTYQGWGLLVENSTKIDCYVNNVSGTFASVGQGTSSTVPMTWNTSDEIYGSFMYEVA
jgi:hypothetical protein